MLKEINNDELITNLKELKQNESILIDINSEDVNLLKLLDVTIQGYNNLFLFYINNTNKEFNIVNLDNFLKKYSNSCKEKFDLFTKIVKNAVGDNVFKFISLNKIRYEINLELNILKLFKA